MKGGCVHYLNYGRNDQPVKVQGKVSLSASNQAQTSGRKVITVKNVNYSLGEQEIVYDFNTTIWRGDKIGVVGLNGSGKSTLLQLYLRN